MATAAPLPPLPSLAAGPCTAARVRRLSRRITQIYDEGLAAYGLTIGQYGVLASLSRREGIGVGILADRLSADASTVSRLLKPLQAAGYLVLDPDPDDRRAKRIRLTDAGADKRRTAAQGWHAAQRQVQDALGDGRLATLHFILDETYSHL
ncbi:MarR family winged helix-turn-helix transcriptional regulator [Polymorphobacter fuscus]|uniref:MarR family transcriptional regulator n=1 Tax=Sandarakinorhabdus fusca TaxID=1439888 RepID=A0A7C9KGY7_9SPHN|nr:MarR family winged helix-turn-helix transcriptional regulator [Polymorphobacter fuscus]KAB7648526.1 winged helix-turn-helix transcriptional regulator [Polymorphobacter fuscus]MQT16061.1 MarR family transcriptional regulator [Polymorphobacter fuscus]NJC07661.1 DNA-binding MarR family transcriptional regulator [Polymorphobacter fuscus]